MILKKEVKEILAIEQNKIHLCHLVNVSYSTMHRWLKDDHEKLTMARIVAGISEVTEIPESDLFEPEFAYQSVSNN